MPKLLSIEEVMKITRKAKPTIYRRTAEGTFPQPVEVPSTALRGPKTKKMWSEKEVLQWNAPDPAQQENVGRTSRHKMGGRNETHTKRRKYRPR